MFDFNKSFNGFEVWNQNNSWSVGHGIAMRDENQLLLPTEYHNYKYLKLEGM